MIISKRSLFKSLVFSLCLLSQVAFSGGQSLFAASKRKKDKASKKNQVETSLENETAESSSDKTSDNSPENATKLSVPKKKSNYFAKIDELIVSGVENGSPTSITAALILLKKPVDEYKENEFVLAFTGLEIMNIVWPSAGFSFDLPQMEVQTPYTGAIDFVKKGFFDSSTGNVDFLSTILPALILTSDNEISVSDMENCRNAILKAREYREESVLLDYLQGLYNKRTGDYAGAKLYFEKLYMTQNSVYEVARNYADIKFALKEYDSAYELSSGLLDKNPSNLDLLKLNASIAFAMKNYEKAEEYVGRGLQQMPNNLEFLLFRARVLVEKGDYIHAVSCLDNFARQNDTNEDYLLLRARVQLEWSKNIARATETIEKELSLYPENKEALLLAARIASTTDAPVAGKYADELVAKILESDPDNIDAQIYALNALEKRSLWQSAYEISHKLIEKESISPDILAKHVEICLELGKTGEAINAATQAYENNPADETIAQAYILAQIAGGNKTQSLTLINSLLETSSKKMKSYLYFRRSFLQGTESAAMADLRKSLTENPRNSEALFCLYEIYFNREDYGKAQYYLKQVVALNPNDTKYKNLNESLTKLLR